MGRASTPHITEVEAEWFQSTSRRQPVGHELFAHEERAMRRGWQPPPSRGFGFAIASVLAVAVATGGTIFFLTPSQRVKHVRGPEPIATTTLTNAEIPPPPATTVATTQGEAPKQAEAMPSAPPPAATVEPATPAEKPADTTATEPKPPPKVAKAEKPRIEKPRVEKPPAEKAPAEKPRSSEPLPDLDRAAAAAGSVPSETTQPSPSSSAPQREAPPQENDDDDLFSTPQTTPSPAPSTTSETPAEDE